MQHKLHLKTSKDKEYIGKIKKLSLRIAQNEIELKKLKIDLENISGCSERISILNQSINGCYQQIFDTIIQEQTTYNEIYSPLSKMLENTSGILNKFSLITKRTANIDYWVSKGEELLDLRKSGKFRGHGELIEVVKHELLDKWGKRYCN